MKLTAEQIEIRAMFRDMVINLINDTKHCRMFGIVNNIAFYLGCDNKTAHEKLAKIPSIGDIYQKQAIAPWLAHNHRAVSDAIYAGKTKEQILAIWKKSKKNHLKSSINTAEVKDEKRKLASVTRMLRETAELKDRAPDQWQRTAWAIVK